MANIILLAVCLVAGIGLNKTGRFPKSTASALNGFIIHISLPALAILHIHNMIIDLSLLLTASMAWLVFCAAWGTFSIFGRMFKIDRKRIGALIMVAGLGNTSFVGLPMIEAYFGKDLLGVGIIADQLGSFMVLSTLGILVSSIYSSGNVSPDKMVRKVIMFPPFQALVFAIFLRPLSFPDWSVTVLEKLGATLTPLALVSVGFQLHFNGIRCVLKPLIFGLGYKLLIAPILIFLLYSGVFGATGIVTKVTIFEAAMAPMITAGIIAIDHDLEPQLVTLMLGIGIPLSFATLHLWYLFLTRIL